MAAVLSRTAASGAVESIGWRYLLASLTTSVAVTSMEQALRVAAAAVGACGADAEAHLRVDLRPDRVELSLQERSLGGVTERDTELAHAVSDAVLIPTAGGTSRELARPVQSLEIALDAMDIPAIRPFWKAVMAYADEPARNGPEDGLVDPAGQLPTIWFQQLDAPRRQRNRVHFDLSVAHDEAEARVRAALDAGGVLVSDSEARAFWILADVEGNEICVCTWQDRDGSPERT